MGEEKEGQHWTQPAYVDPKIGDAPPVGAVIDKDAVCRNCMTVSEEITMRRGFVDSVSPGEAAEKGYSCARCGKALSTGS
jgi:hypothetical protein